MAPLHGISSNIYRKYCGLGKKRLMYLILTNRKQAESIGKSIVDSGNMRHKCLSGEERRERNITVKKEAEDDRLMTARGT